MFLSGRKIISGRTPSEQHFIECVEDSVSILKLDSVPDIVIIETLDFPFLFATKSAVKNKIYVSIPFLMIDADKIFRLTSLEIYRMSHLCVEKLLLKTICRSIERAHTVFMFEVESGIKIEKGDLDIFKEIPFPCRYVTSYCKFDELESIGENDFVRPYDALNDEQKSILQVRRDTINACLSTMLGNVIIPSNTPTLKKKRLTIPQNKIDYFLDVAYMGIRHSGKNTIEKIASDTYAILKELDLKNIYIRDSYMLFYKRLALLAYT